MSSGVYQIRNLINGKVYIGSALDFEKRWGPHKALLRSNRLKHHSRHLQAAWNKYGEENFVFEILIHCEIGLLLCYEQKYMDFFCSYEADFGYNMTKVAGSWLGMKQSEEAKKKISVAKLGMKFSVETKQKMRAARIGMKLSMEHKKNISLAMRDRTVSSEWRRKLSKFRLGKKHTDETRKKISEGHLVRLTWPQVREIREKYVSGDYFQTDLAEEYGVCRATISKIVRNKIWLEENES